MLKTHGDASKSTRAVNTICQRMGVVPFACDCRAFKYPQIALRYVTLPRFLVELRDYMSAIVIILIFNSYCFVQQLRTVICIACWLRDNLFVSPNHECSFTQICYTLKYLCCFLVFVVNDNNVPFCLI